MRLLGVSQAVAVAVLAWSALDARAHDAVTWLTAGIALAAAAALAVTGAHLARGRVLRDADRAAVSQLAHLVASATNLRQVMAQVCQAAVAATGAERALVLRYLPGHGAEVVGASAGAAEHLGRSVALAPNGTASRCRADGAPAGGTRPVMHHDDAGVTGGPTAGSIALPFTVDDNVWGCLVCTHPDAADFHTREAPLLEQLGLLTGLAVGNDAHRKALQVQAATDPLTGLTNHPTFRQMLDSEVARAQRHGRALALMVVDMDHFANVNETLGHAGADQVLVDLADLLRAQARAEDVIARIGGQDFAWLMPDCTSLSAWAAAERLRAAVTRGPLGGMSRLTVSAGTCDLMHADGTGSRLFELASGALYWAKQNGRDMCVRYSPDVVVDLSAGERATRLERRRALDAVRLLAQAVDARDAHTQRHSERVADVSVALATCLGWGDDDVRRLREAAVVHDVGKIGIPDSVLLKNGPLDAAERARIETHAALGAQMVSDVLSPEQTSWVRGHHERWDGTGYPDRLAGTDIPAGARLMAVADAYDAMVSDRPYRRGLGVDLARAVIRGGAGGQFCPEAVDAFQMILARGEISAIYETPGREAPRPKG